MIKRTLYSICSMFMILSLVGCNYQEAKSTNSHIALLKTTNPSPTSIKSESSEQELVSKIQKDVESFNEIYDVAIVKGKDTILIAYKVKHLQRFHMKNIEKKLNKKLEENYPDENFTVSSDYKIFLETVELTKQLQKPNFSEKKANEKLNNIIQLQKELT